ncbi:hypothetical protein FPOAC1_000013 [Fusarium poae]|uniref:hypothetical protein n=1 Tax=Fusarium poae TaxID=36050 RepID=UPI001CE995AF|nr:hypothetical protein FPOAC1_000013 [Fusarium poae]KAG8674050.1 hypothetical protein FPOAC1_000013 [Fusarium poae]
MATLPHHLLRQQPLPLHPPAADLKLILPRQNPEEVRSYNYFIQVTAPSLSGAFYADFWLVEVPRVCLFDAAIWHAVVSLGAAHEDYSENGLGSRSIFALKQFNSSIRCLTESRSPRHADRWRALIVGTISTYVCTIKGLHDQTRIHLQAVCSLLRELQSKTLKKGKLQETTVLLIPVSVAPIQSILTNLELLTNALENGGMTGNPALLSQNKVLNAWRSYTAPQSSLRLSPEDVDQAYRAAESLMSGLVLFSQEHAKQLLDVQTGKSGLEGLSMLATRQEAHTRCFNEIKKAISMFQHEIARSSGRTTQLEAHTILPLHLYHTSNRLLFIQDPDEPDLDNRQLALPSLYTTVVNLAEQIMNLDPSKTRKVSYTQQLFLVAHSGIGQSTRQRAVSLLRRPRLEGGWDSLISASLAEAIMDREKEAAFEYKVEQGLKTETVGTRGEDSDPMFRIFNITFAFTEGRKARVVLRTWWEKLNNIAGQARVIQCIGWKYYFTYIVFLIAFLVIAYFFYLETKGRTLEQMTHIFDGEDAETEPLGDKVKVMSVELERKSG